MLNFTTNQAPMIEVFKDEIKCQIFWVLRFDVRVIKPNKITFDTSPEPEPESYSYEPQHILLRDKIGLTMSYQMMEDAKEFKVTDILYQAIIDYVSQKCKATLSDQECMQIIEWLWVAMAPEIKNVLLLNDIPNFNASAYVDASSNIQSLAGSLPCANEHVALPCCNGTRMMILMKAVIHLNDNERWTREAIADWLETLDLDLSF